MMRLAEVIFAMAVVSPAAFASILWATWPREPDWRSIMDQAEATGDVAAALTLYEAVLPGAHPGIFRAVATMVDNAEEDDLAAFDLPPDFVADTRERAERAERGRARHHRFAVDYGDGFSLWRDGPFTTLFAHTCGRVQAFAESSAIDNARLRRGMVKEGLAKPHKIRGDLLATRLCAEIAWRRMGRDTRMDQDHHPWSGWARHEALAPRRAMADVRYLAGDHEAGYGVDFTYDEPVDFLKNYWSENPEDCHQWRWLIQNAGPASRYQRRKADIDRRLTGVCAEERK